MRQWAALLQPGQPGQHPPLCSAIDRDSAEYAAWTAGEQSASQRAGSSIRARAVRSRASPSGEACHRAWA